MKKLSALFLALVLLVSAVPTAFAANTTPNTTTLTTTVPSATYVLNIPADQEIPFGQTSMGIGNVTITDSKSFAVGKNVEVTVVYEPFTAEDTGISTKIPYKLQEWSSSGVTKYPLFSGEKMVYKGKADGTVAKETEFTYSKVQFTMAQLGIEVESTDWGKALAGDYKSTITFTSEVVAE